MLRGYRLLAVAHIQFEATTWGGLDQLKLRLGAHDFWASKLKI
jgi:hypothetical protein